MPLVATQTFINNSNMAINEPQQVQFYIESF
jgi:hypothetical protein